MARPPCRIAPAPSRPLFAPASQVASADTSHCRKPPVRGWPPSGKCFDKRGSCYLEAARRHTALISGALQNILLQRTMSWRVGIGKATMSEVWNTKYGPRRVRFDPPTLNEAIAAARGLTGELQLQAEIAASLMDLPVEAVRAELLKTAPSRGRAQIVTNGREGTGRTVIVERKRSRVQRP